MTANEQIAELVAMPNMTAPLPKSLVQPRTGHDTHITVTIHLSRNSTLYGIRSMLDSLAFFLRAKMCCYRDESGHLYFDLTPTATTSEAAR